jgi:hypothetical protein
MLKAEDSEKGEKVGKFRVQKEVLATQEEKLLDCKEYQKDRHDCLIGEEGNGTPEKEASR